jgi:hypothetical protein
VEHVAGAGSEAAAAIGVLQERVPPDRLVREPSLDSRDDLLGCGHFVGFQILRLLPRRVGDDRLAGVLVLVWARRLGQRRSRGTDHERDSGGEYEAVSKAHGAPFLPSDVPSRNRAPSAPISFNPDATLCPMRNSQDCTC